MVKNIKINNLGDKKSLNNEVILNKKIIGNAISSYLMIFVSGLFLFNKTNLNINNDFVKSHTKSALLIHLGFLITYIIFISNSLFGNIYYFGLGLNHLLANIIFILLLFYLILGIYKANKGLIFKVTEKINLTSKKTLLDINGDGKITEKEKLTVLLSFIPLLGFINYGKYRKNTIIQEGVRVNIIISLTIVLLYILSYGNLANILFLAYIILIAFIGINLFTRNEIIQIKLPSYFSPEELYFRVKSIKAYLIIYFSNKKFSDFSSLLNHKNELKIKESIKNTTDLKLKKDIKIPSTLIYIPIINLIFIYFINSKYKFHIINGLILTTITILLFILGYFIYINPKIYLLFLFPIFFGIGYLNNRLAYKMPFIFDIYLLFKKIFKLFIFSAKEIKKKSSEVNETHLKVKS